MADTDAMDLTYGVDLTADRLPDALVLALDDVAEALRAVLRVHDAIGDVRGAVPSAVHRRVPRGLSYADTVRLLDRLVTVGTVTAEGRGARRRYRFTA